MPDHIVALGDRAGPSAAAPALLPAEPVHSTGGPEVGQRGLLAVAAVFLGLAGVALLGAALVDDPLALLDDLHPGRYVASGLAAARDLLPRLALAVLAGVLLTGCYLAIRSWRPLPGSTARPALLAVRRGSTHLPSTQKVDERLRRFQRRHPERAAVLFFRMLTDNKYWLRLEEVFTVVGRNVHLQSWAQFQFDRDELGAERERLVVPLLVLPKGALLDNFVVTDDAGNRLAVLSRSDSHSAVVLVLHGLFCETLRAADPDLVPGACGPPGTTSRSASAGSSGSRPAGSASRPTPPGASPTTRACAASGAARRADAVTYRA